MKPIDLIWSGFHDLILKKAYCKSSNLVNQYFTVTVSLFAHLSSSFFFASIVCEREGLKQGDLIWSGFHDLILKLGYCIPKLQAFFFIILQALCVKRRGWSRVTAWRTVPAFVFGQFEIQSPNEKIPKAQHDIYISMKYIYLPLVSRKKLWLQNGSVGTQTIAFRYRCVL